MTDHDEMPYGLVDGNALAGPLSDLFAIDVTAASVTCAGCGTRQPIAVLAVYSGGPGLVARCRACRNVMLRVGRIGSDALLDLRGTVVLRVEAASEPI
jgi:Family of unknown function (DUF6510)